MKHIIKFLFIAAISFFACTEEDKVIPDEMETVDGYELMSSYQTASFDDYIVSVQHIQAYSDEMMDILRAYIAFNGMGPEYEEVRYYDYVYASVNPDGKPANLSARLYVPVSAFEGETMKGLALMNRHLTLCAKNNPTTTITFESYVAWKGYIVIIPDGYGMGESSYGYPVIYDASYNGRVNVDALEAGMKLIEDLGLHYQEDRIYNCGYSYGGCEALGNLKYVAQHPESGITFYKTFAGGAVTDFEMTFREYLTDDWSAAASFFIPTIVSILVNHPDIDPKDVFVEPLLSEYERLILSKQYTHFAFKDYLKDFELSECLTEQMLSQTSALSKKFFSLLKGKRIPGGWNIPEGSKLYLFHCKDDEFVPYDNFVVLNDYFKLKTAPDRFESMSDYYIAHELGVLPFFIYAYNNWK